MKPKRRAARHGRSTEAEYLEILQAVSKDLAASFETNVARLRRLTRKREQTRSEVLLREGCVAR